MTNSSSQPPENPLVAEADVIFDMASPGFQDQENDWFTEMDQSGIPVDGTVLYLNQLLLNDESSVLIKSSAEDRVHLIVDSPLVNSDIVNVSWESSEATSAAHHYYEFPNDLKVYSEHSLTLVYLEG